MEGEARMINLHEFAGNGTACTECGLSNEHRVHQSLRRAAPRSAATLKFHVPNHGHIVDMAETQEFITAAQVAERIGYSVEEAENELRHCTRRGWVRMSRASNADGSFLEFRWVREGR